jgi:cystathionine gamma-synthase
MIASVDLETMLAHGLFENASGGLSPALDRSATYEHWPLPPGQGGPYGRSRSSTAADAERLLGAIEDAQALVFASGMTAWTTLCFTLLEPGRSIAIPDQGYYGVEELTHQLFERFGIGVRRYHAGDLDGLAAASDGATLALVETPANPHMTVIDITRAAEAVHAGGGLLVCDNTVATALQQRPLDLGADLTWQSGTKFLAGHSDAIAGVLATRNEEVANRVRVIRTAIGSILAPDAAWLLLRGLRTLAVRVQRQSASALEIARRLGTHPAVNLVRYAGLESNPGHDTALRQMRGGFGGLLAFEVADAATAERVEDSLRLVRRATSLGSVETLCERRARIEPENRVHEGLLRLSIGLEHVDDIWDDLERALAAARA